jgi:hypothetical protein
MKRRPYCCDDSRELYERYYDRQQKGEGEFPIYVGRYSQGSRNREYHRCPVQTNFTESQSSGTHVLQAGANVLEDVTKGKSWKDSAIKRIPKDFTISHSENNPDRVHVGNGNAQPKTYSTDEMAFIHEGSCECAKSELDLLSIPATQTSIESGIYVEYHPVSSIRDGAPIKFDVTASGDDYIDLADSFLYARAKIIRANGDKLDAADTAEPVKNFLHSLFSQVDISLNGTLIASSMNAYIQSIYRNPTQFRNRSEVLAVDARSVLQE